MSKNIKEWLYAFMIIVGLLGLYLLYIVLSNETESKSILVSDMKKIFTKNFISPKGCDLIIDMVSSNNSEIKGIILLKMQNKIIFQKKINTTTIKSSVYDSNQSKTYSIVPAGKLKQNIEYTLFGKFTKIPKNSYLYLKYNKSTIGGFFCNYGLDFFRVKL